MIKDTSKNRNALIVFLKNPVPGRVKTRLASGIGDEKALRIYLELISITSEAVKNLAGTSVFLYFDEAPPVNASAEKHRVRVQAFRNGYDIIVAVQAGNDLGKRMLNAFEEVKKQSFEKICIIGTDCPGVSTGLLEEAFHVLDTRDLVIGPAFDGGYYLLGMKQIHAELFVDKNWSTPSVLESTLADAEKAGLTVAQLKKLRDIDDTDDLVFFPELESRIFTGKHTG
ncbi:MAG: TIGR04282 family arsenosugar biosynthesis glycosyltransferase [Cyclonatronaceae bacterium]